MVLKLKDTVENVMLRTQNQIYIAPSKILRNYIAHYTISFVSNNIVPDSLTLIPDASGCLIFTYDGTSFAGKLWGATTKTYIVKNDVNSCPMRLFIEFLPGGLFYLTGIKQTDLTNLQIPIWQINDLLNSLVADAFESSKDLNSFIERINSILLSYMQNRIFPPALLSSVMNIKRHNGYLSIKELANINFYSERHLNRLFNDYLGMNVKTFSRITRINHVLQKMSNGHNSLDIIQMAGFYDQAHFIHDFKSICGTTPKIYFENMSEFYNEPFKF